MTRQLTITAAEWASVQNGALWLVREGVRQGSGLSSPGPADASGSAFGGTSGSFPPVEFVQASALYETCGGTRIEPYPGGKQNPCPSCRIELVGPADWCEDCQHVPMRHCRLDHHRIMFSGAVIATRTLGHAYAVGQPLPIIRGWSRPDGDSSGDVLSIWKGHYGPDVVMRRAWNATAIQTQYADITDRLAHYGPPESLVGKWAQQFTAVQP